MKGLRYDPPPSTPPYLQGGGIQGIIQQDDLKENDF